MDRLTVIIPVYNAEKTLEKCVCSVINQSYHNLEIILVDDGSKDKSGLICDEYAKKDNRIKVIHKSNAGVSAARNEAIDISTGKYLLFIDSDDYVEEKYAEHLYNAVTSDEDLCMAVCGVIFEGEENFLFPAHNLSNVITADTMQKYLLRGYKTKGWLWNKIYSRNLIANERLNESLHFLEDLEFNLRILNNSEAKVVFADTYDYHYVINKTSASHQNNKRITGIETFHSYIDYLDESNEKKFRYIRDYLNQLKILAISDLFDKSIESRNALYIKKNYKYCWHMLDKSQKIQCFLIAVNYKLYKFAFKSLNKMRDFNNDK